MNRILALVIILLAIVGYHSTYSYAEENEGFPFAIEMIPPTDQIDNLGYYHVPGKPGENKTFQMKVANISDQPIEVKFVPMNAYSKEDGIFYQGPKEVNSDMYVFVDDKYELAQYMNTIAPIMLLPNQAEVVSISLVVPNLSSGTLLGSIRFIVFEGTNEVQKLDKEKNTSSILIDKYHSFDTAVQIDLPQPVKSAISLGATTFNGDNSNVSFEIVNEAGFLQNNISGNYEIQDKDNNKLFEGTINPFKMAPMTKFQYPINWNYKTLEAGNFKLILNVNVDGVQKESEKPFVIENKSVEQVLEKQAEINPEIILPKQSKLSALLPVWTWLVIGIVVVLLIIIIVVLLLTRRQPRIARTNYEPAQVVFQQPEHEPAQVEIQQPLRLSRVEKYRR
jgi:hypothetical protein